MKKIKKAKLENSVEISKLIRDTLKKINAKTETKKDLDFELAQYTPTKIREYIKTKEVFCLIDDSRIIGVIIFDKKEKVLNSLFLEKSSLGKGLGEKMLKFIEKKAKANKIKEILLYPTTHAINFYKRQGYKLKRKFMGTENKGKIIMEWGKKLK